MDSSESDAGLSPVEHIKQRSNYLRGTIAEGLANRVTGAVAEDDVQVLKFHGMYQQDDRDVRNERARQKLEPAYAFMIRVRAPGGVLTPEQWLTIDRLGREHGGESVRLTTRQSLQIHGVIKWDLSAVVQSMHAVLLDSLAACGDVNRNTMCNPNPHQSAIHAAVYEVALKLSRKFTPHTTAYHEIWIDGRKQADSRAESDEEPLYGASYLPRKFKIGIAVPPSNDVDVFTHDLGLIAILSEGRLEGFNVSAGGGMGMTYGEPETYPNLGRVVGYCAKEEVVDVCEAIMRIQRDSGDRTNRKHARLKYTIDDRGLEWFSGELAARLDHALEPARPYTFDTMGDRFGWVDGDDGCSHLTLFIQNGRIRDWEGYRLMSGLREIAEIHDGDFRLTPNQNLIVARVSKEKRPLIDEIVSRYGLASGSRHSALRRSSIACVALPTCGLAMAESERYLPELLGKIERILEEAGLFEEEIVIRMSGCPNGCSRPYVAEIALTGKAPGSYNLYLGGAFNGSRLGRLFRENIDEREILETLEPMILRYAGERRPGEHFGDFVVRAGYVRTVESGRDFHSDEAK